MPETLLTLPDAALHLVFQACDACTVVSLSRASAQLASYCRECLARILAVKGVPEGGGLAVSRPTVLFER